ncbi:AAA family ATPase [uncultured Dechloromonas sp.]|uniref:AAA family ATPase n=1 Tax=uncultured Dechloromonas sp. TaxID=171719 RepID=UPI0025DCFF79|nr:AAA family ATPase [uncultured Dechloromonas sp.]
MKLERFGKIRGHRIFKNFTWPITLEEFGRFNLVYGWNGTGKTTLSGLLKSLQTGTAVLEGDVDFVLDGTTVAGKDLSQVGLPQVRVFSRDTVARSVFESTGGALGQLPPVYVFGEESAEKQRQLDAIKANLPALTEAVRIAAAQETKAQKDLDDYATATARSIKNLLVAPGGSFNNYNAADFRTNMSRFGASPAAQLAPEERQALLDMKDAQALPSVQLAVVAFPDLLKLQQEVQDALRASVVSAVIDELAANPTVASWVQSGLSLHIQGGDAAACKFCNQPLPATRLRQLEAHFNDQFRQFNQNLAALVGRIENAANAIGVVTLPSSKDLYPELRREYEEACGGVKLHLNNVRSGLLALARAVRVKQERVFESLDLRSLLSGGSGLPDDDVSILARLMEALSAGLPALGEFMGRLALERVNALLAKHNSKTVSFAEQVKSTRERLHLHELSVALPGWSEKQTRLEDATKLHAAAKESWGNARLDMLALETDIRDHRQPADELNRELVAYLGHDEIQVAVEDNGYRLVRCDGAATNLSEGERTAIAFLYFLKSLQDRSFDLEHGIVVVDDPISSLDTNAIYSAFGFMKRRLCDAGQLFVLTHNYTFLRQVKNWFGHLNRGRGQKPARFFMLRAAYRDGQRNSALEALDPFLRDYESEYHFLFKRVVEASGLPGGAPLQSYYELPNLARRLLEAFLVFKVPDQKTLHARLEVVDFDGPKKTRIQRFLDTHSHAEQIGEGHDDASALGEAPEVLRDVLALIKECDERHFARMKLAIAPPV